MWPITCCRSSPTGRSACSASPTRSPGSASTRRPRRPGCPTLDSDPARPERACRGRVRRPRHRRRPAVASASPQSRPHRGAPVVVHGGDDRSSRSAAVRSGSDRDRLPRSAQRGPARARSAPAFSNQGLGQDDRRPGAARHGAPGARTTASSRSAPPPRRSRAWPVRVSLGSSRSTCAAPDGAGRSSSTCIATTAGRRWSAPTASREYPGAPVATPHRVGRAGAPALSGGVPSEEHVRATRAAWAIRWPRSFITRNPWTPCSRADGCGVRAQWHRSRTFDNVNVTRRKSWTIGDSRA